MMTDAAAPDNDDRGAKRQCNARAINTRKKRVLKSYVECVKNEKSTDHE
jgi:hypothetical protein